MIVAVRAVLRVDRKEQCIPERCLFTRVTLSRSNATPIREIITTNPRIALYIRTLIINAKAGLGRWASFVDIGSAEETRLFDDGFGGHSSIRR